MVSQSKRVETTYQPRKLQGLLHSIVLLYRFIVLVCHRRFGKTVWAINEMIDRGLCNELHKPQYAYIAPTYGQAKRVAWEYLKDFTKNIPGRVVNEAELRVDLHRPDKEDFVRYILLGAENPDSIRGIYLDGAIIDEFAQCDPTLFSQVVRPALSDRKGWCVFIGTPKGQNHFHDLRMHALDMMMSASSDDPRKGSKSWFTKLYKATETGIIDEDELDDAKASMSPEEFAQEYECSFTAALFGSYYGKYLEEIEANGHITNVPHSTNYLVDTYWDLGMDDSMTIWFIQQIGREYRIIDYYENSGKGIEYYAKICFEKPYNYGECVLPHDAAARELTSGKTREEVFRQHGFKTTILERANVADGIQAVRTLMPQCWFDKTKTHKGLLCLRNYQKKWDGKLKRFLDKPLHDWSSHGADSFRTFAMGVRPSGSRMMAHTSKLPRHTSMEYDIFE